MWEAGFKGLSGFVLSEVMCAIIQLCGLCTHQFLGLGFWGLRLGVCMDFARVRG